MAKKRRVGDRGDYVRDYMPASAHKILDVGCAYGWALGDLQRQRPDRELWGIDMDRHALEKAREVYHGINFVHQTAAELPFEDASFDAVILSDVIEHVGNENKQMVIDECHRVLRPGGAFVFTAPYDSLTAWADPMDFKRRATPVYRLYMKLSGYKPVDAIELGHQHVSWPEIVRLFGDRFEFKDVLFSGLWTPWLMWMCTIGERTRLFTPKVVEKVNRYRGWESGSECPQSLAYSVRLLAIKKGGDAAPEKMATAGAVSARGAL